jgi:hypothetical protein
LISRGREQEQEQSPTAETLSSQRNHAEKTSRNGVLTFLFVPRS